MLLTVALQQLGLRIATPPFRNWPTCWLSLTHLLLRQPTTSSILYTFPLACSISPTDMYAHFCFGIVGPPPRWRFVPFVEAQRKPPTENHPPATGHRPPQAPLRKSEKEREKIERQKCGGKRICAICWTLRGIAMLGFSRALALKGVVLPSSAHYHHPLSPSGSQCGSAQTSHHWRWHWLRQVWKDSPGRDTPTAAQFQLNEGAGCAARSHRATNQRARAGVI